MKRKVKSPVKKGSVDKRKIKKAVRKATQSRQSRLTLKRVFFAYEYPKDFNGAKAAERAGFSHRTAKQQAHKLLKDPQVKKLIDRLIEQRRIRTELTQDSVLKEIAIVAFSDIKNLLIKNEVNEFVSIADIKELPDEVSRSIQAITLKPDEIKFKLWDKNKALELAARHLGMLKGDTIFPENLTFRITYANGDGAKPKSSKGN